MNALILTAAAAGLCFGQTTQPVGGGTVQSDEWKIRRAPEKEEEFIGDVRYRGAENAFSSDWAHFRHEPQIWRARGNVRIEHAMKSGDVLAASGDEASYNQKTLKGELMPRITLALEAARPEGATPGARTRRLESWADKARYDGQEGTLVLSGGRPVARKIDPEPGGWTGAVKADEIAAHREGRRVTARGKTVGWIEFPRQRGPGRTR